MTLRIPEQRPNALFELSKEENEALEDEERIRQLSERLKEQFQEALSGPLPIELFELVDQLEEDEFGDK